MDPVKLYHHAEQRCHSYGCQVSRCMKEANDPPKCNALLNRLQECIEKEKQYILSHLEEFPQKKSTGKSK